MPSVLEREWPDFEILETGFIDYVLSFDMCCLNETFTESNLGFSKLFEDQMVLHSPGVKLSNRGRCCRGVAVFVRKMFASFITVLPTNCDNTVAFRLCSPALDNCVFITVYIPPNDSPYYANEETVCNVTLLDDFVARFQGLFPYTPLLFVSLLLYTHSVCITTNDTDVM